MQIKEFLDTEKGYVLVKDTCKRSEYWIEVPEGANLLTGFNGEKNYLFWIDKESEKCFDTDNRFGWWIYGVNTLDDYINNHNDCIILWQRPQQPESLPFIDDEAQSLNDQYAEIEQVRQQSIDATLAERQSTYGSFEDVAFVTENIINVLKKCNYNEMPHTHRMAMYMIASKMARIANGDFNFIESWHDISGYAKLIENELMQTDGATNSRVVYQVVKDGVLEDKNES